MLNEYNEYIEWFANDTGQPFPMDGNLAPPRNRIDLRNSAQELLCIAVNHLKFTKLQFKGGERLKSDDLEVSVGDSA